MGWLKFAAILMCVWGTTSFASLPGADDERQLQSIQSWMADVSSVMDDINTQYGVNVHLRKNENLKSDAVRSQIQIDLQNLIEELSGQSRLEAPLMMLTCKHVVCGGADGGGG